MTREDAKDKFQEYLIELEKKHPVGAAPPPKGTAITKAHKVFDEIFDYFEKDVLYKVKGKYKSDFNVLQYGDDENRNIVDMPTHNDEVADNTYCEVIVREIK